MMPSDQIIALPPFAHDRQELIVEVAVGILHQRFECHADEGVVDPRRHRSDRQHHDDLDDVPRGPEHGLGQRQGADCHPEPHGGYQHDDRLVEDVDERVVELGGRATR